MNTAMPLLGGAIPLCQTGQQKEPFPYPASASCLWVNSGRAALECIIRSLPQQPEHVLLPRFICNTLTEPLQRLGIPIIRYGISPQLHPLLPRNIGQRDAIIAVNYFGLTETGVHTAAKQYPGQVIMDATTAFYTPVIPGVPAFYSPRKFTGLAEGGIAVAHHPFRYQPCATSPADTLSRQLQQSPHNEVLRQQAEDALTAPPQHMAPLTRELMLSTPWGTCAQKRLENYAELHRALRSINRLQLPEHPAYAPMCYPLICGLPGLRDELIDAGIHLPLYWPEVIAATESTETENYLARTLLPLPLDQRYNRTDMQRLIRLILG